MKLQLRYNNGSYVTACCYRHREYETSIITSLHRSCHRGTGCNFAKWADDCLRKNKLIVRITTENDGHIHRYILYGQPGIQRIYSQIPVTIRHRIWLVILMCVIDHYLISSGNSSRFKPYANIVKIFIVFGQYHRTTKQLDTWSEIANLKEIKR